MLTYKRARKSSYSSDCILATGADLALFRNYRLPNDSSVIFFLFKTKVFAVSYMNEIKIFNQQIIYEQD